MDVLQSFVATSALFLGLPAVYMTVEATPNNSGPPPRAETPVEHIEKKS